MFKLISRAIAIAIAVTPVVAARYADSVTSYHPGSGFAVEFSSGIGYTNAAVSLGEPSRITPGIYGGPVDPFNPAYLKEQLVSLGAGGSLTVEFSNPILNDGANPYGVDFIIFGSSGLISDFTTGMTDGTLFSNNSGETRVSVSSDNLTYYQLSPSLAPVVDGAFPTDGTGDFSIPVDPILGASSFNGLNLGGVRQLYRGSGGGTGFDLDWALNENGEFIDIDEIRFVRVDVLSGRSEIDGFAVVPEPSVASILFVGITVLATLNQRRRP